MHAFIEETTKQNLDNFGHIKMLTFTIVPNTASCPIYVCNIIYLIYFFQYNCILFTLFLKIDLILFVTLYQVGLINVQLLFLAVMGNFVM